MSVFVGVALLLVLVWGGALSWTKSKRLRLALEPGGPWHELVVALSRGFALDDALQPLQQTDGGRGWSAQRQDAQLSLIVRVLEDGAAQLWLRWRAQTWALPADLRVLPRSGDSPQDARQVADAALDRRWWFLAPDDATALVAHSPASLALWRRAACIEVESAREGLRYDPGPSPAHPGTLSFEARMRPVDPRTHPEAYQAWRDELIAWTCELACWASQSRALTRDASLQEALEVALDQARDARRALALYHASRRPDEPIGATRLASLSQHPVWALRARVALEAPTQLDELTRAQSLARGMIDEAMAPWRPEARLAIEALSAQALTSACDQALEAFEALEALEVEPRSDHALEHVAQILALAAQPGGAVGCWRCWCRAVASEAVRTSSSRCCPGSRRCSSARRCARRCAKRCA